MQTVVHGERVSPHYLVHAGTAEPLRVSPPEAVAYLLELGGSVEVFNTLGGSPLSLAHGG